MGDGMGFSIKILVVAIAFFSLGILTNQILASASASDQATRLATVDHDFNNEQFFLFPTDHIAAKDVIINSKGDLIIQNLDNAKITGLKQTGSNLPLLSSNTNVVEIPAEQVRVGDLVVAHNVLHAVVALETDEQGKKRVRTQGLFNNEPDQKPGEPGIALEEIESVVVGFFS